VVAEHIRTHTHILTPPFASKSVAFELSSSVSVKARRRRNDCGRKRRGRQKKKKRKKKSRRKTIAGCRWKDERPRKVSGVSRKAPTRGCMRQMRRPSRCRRVEKGRVGRSDGFVFVFYGQDEPRCADCFCSGQPRLKMIVGFDQRLYGAFGRKESMRRIRQMLAFVSALCSSLLTPNRLSAEEAAQKRCAASTRLDLQGSPVYAARRTGWRWRGWCGGAKPAASASTDGSCDGMHMSSSLHTLPMSRFALASDQGHVELVRQLHAQRTLRNAASV
jgi:hypothetical protein